MSTLLLGCYCFQDFRGGRARKHMCLWYTLAYINHSATLPSSGWNEPSSCFSSLNQIPNPQLPPLQIFLLAASTPLALSLPGLLAGLPTGCCSEPLQWLFSAWDALPSDAGIRSLRSSLCSNVLTSERPSLPHLSLRLSCLLFLCHSYHFTTLYLVLILQGGQALG